MTTILFQDCSTCHQDQEIVSTIPFVSFDGLKVIKNFYETPTNDGFPLAKIFKENLGKPSQNMSHLKRLDKYYRSLDTDNYHKYKLLTINYPLKDHFLYTSKQLYKKMRAIIDSLKRYGCINRAFTCFEYSKDNKFHCHSLIEVFSLKKLNKRLTNLRKQTSNKAYHITHSKSSQSIYNFTRYLSKDIIHMTSGEEITIKCGSFTLNDVLNYKPIEITSKKIMFISHNNLTPINRGKVEDLKIVKKSELSKLL